ncbi:MAG: hypothetical protein ACREUQ_10610 [Burkholderiales bacterium]
MIGKISGLSRALAVVLALVAAFVQLGALDVALVLVVLGLIAGIGYDAEATTRVILTTLVLPMVAIALGHIPEIGAQLSAFAGNLALATAGAAAMAILLRIFGLIRADLTGLTK